MSQDRNKFGLGRTIPPEIKADVRRLCRYGCVVCGAIPFDYDHFRVPFAECTEHNADDIILLCDRHHRMKGARLLGVDVIEVALKRRRAGDHDFHFKLDLTSQDFQIHWPHNDISAAVQGIIIDGKPIFELKMQENELEPILLSGILSDYKGNDICIISDNEIVSRSNAIGDFTLTNNLFVYHSVDGNEALRFRLDDKGLHIEKIYHVRGDAYVRNRDGFLYAGNLIHTAKIKDFTAAFLDVAFDIGTCADRWDFSACDLSARPSSQMVGGLIVHSHAIAQFGGIPRTPISYTFGSPGISQLRR